MLFFRYINLVFGQWKNWKLQICSKWLTVKPNWVNFGILWINIPYAGYIWPCSVEGVLCICDFPSTFPKGYSSHCWGSLSTKLCTDILCDRPHKSYFLEFKFQVKNDKRLKVNILTNRKSIIANIVEVATQKERDWNLGSRGTIVEHTCTLNAFASVPFRVILGSFGTLFSKWTETLVRHIRGAYLILQSSRSFRGSFSAFISNGMQLQKGCSWSKT